MGGTGDTPAAERVGLEFLFLAHRVRRVVDDRMAAGGLSLARTKLLRLLDEQGPTRLSSLAEQLGFAARSVTETVDGLARDGLVERGPDPTDRRAKLVVITREGNAVLATASTAGERVLQDIFGALDDDQRTTLGGLLGAIDTAARAAADTT
ncbi:MarR family winged helix-turn-helix transcriptional regulator [Streptomyces sp. NPDC060131]|uniref:MarR family winged helix-turn-helix transcriptional regulator n=1 Tax=unclassified Streptomyces TaxID=2593676 RepID=UPI00364A9EC3